MIFTTPFGLLALLAVPAIVAIHLFRRRFPVRPVAGLFLWQTARQIPEQGRKVTRLPITTSLILECLAALALALILAGARLSSAGGTRHLVVLLDDSASMAAVNTRGESARDRAVRRVLAEVDRLGGGGRVTLVRSGDRPSVLLGPTAFAVEARPALAGWKPEAPHHSLALGVRLARELAGRDGRLMVMTDLAPALEVTPNSTTPSSQGEPFEGALVVSVGEPLVNVGITAAERTLSPAEGRGAVALTLVNYSGSPARRRVTVTVAGSVKAPADGSAKASAERSAIVLDKEIDVPPRVSSLTLPLPAGLPAVRVALSNDALARDDEVWLAEPRPRIVWVENRLHDGRGRQALAKALDAISGVTGAESGHLAFVEADDIDRAAPPGAWRVAFGPPPAPWAVAGESKDFIGPFVLEKRHPLIAGVTLGGVVWPGAAMLAPSAVRPIVSAGDRVLVGLAAGGVGQRPDPTILFNIDLDRTNLIRAPDWPILVSNVVEMRRQSLPGPERWNYRVGEWVRVRLGRDPKGPVRYRCGAVERDLPAGRQLEFMTPSPGGLLQILEGDEVLYELGVNFLDEAESDLRRQSTGEAGQLRDVTLRAESGPQSDPLFWLLLAIAGTSILANWWWLAARAQPASRGSRA
jgi:Aerotolerance regulator N-terminal/von Willebrand factor type A domain